MAKLKNNFTKKSEASFHVNSHNTNNIMESDKIYTVYILNYPIISLTLWIFLHNSSFIDWFSQIIPIILLFS